MSRPAMLFSVLLATVLSVPAGAVDAPYCLALRGNGESEPAHWGALANLVEKRGLPKAQAGGSSATISLFLLENIAANPLVVNAQPEERRNRAALLLKSLTGIAGYLAESPQAKAGITIYKSYQGGNMQVLKSLALGLQDGSSVTAGGANAADLQQLARDLHSFGLGDSPRYMFLLDVLANPTRVLRRGEARKVAFYAGELRRAMATFGSFDAESDADLFFRDGVINFRKLGLAIGRVATFLSGRASNAATEQAMNDFIRACESKQFGKTWLEIVQNEPSCQEKLNLGLNSFFSQEIDWASANVANASLEGGRILTLPTTAVLTKSAYKAALETYTQYHTRLNRSVSKTFKVPNVADVRLGYWGRPSALARVETTLREKFQGDVKSEMFLALGPATWADVLSLSPAEPGLASLQPMKVNGEDAYSAGGWSDLHPIPVLKALGCEEVIYVTRKGGESLFGQGVAKRVFNLDRSWDVLRTSDAQSTERNSRLNSLGDASDMTSLWSRLYNVANPKSSFMLSVSNADAVLCTDWNRFEVKTQFNELVTESYQAPFLVRASRDDVKSRLQSGGASFVEDTQSLTNGVPDWVGCR